LLNLIYSTADLFYIIYTYLFPNEIVNHFFVAFPVFSFNVQVFECKVSKLILIRLFYTEEIIAFKINVSHCHMV